MKKYRAMRSRSYCVVKRDNAWIAHKAKGCVMYLKGGMDEHGALQNMLDQPRVRLSPSKQDTMGRMALEAHLNV